MPQALEVFKFIVAQNPNHISANTNLGYIYMQQGDKELAYKYLMHANQLDPDYEQNLINLSVWYHNNNQLAASKNCLMHLIQKHPDNQHAKAMLADLGK